MPDIVITEFMDEAAVDSLRARFDTLYDPELVDKGGELARAAETARALIVRNRTKVRGALLEGSGNLSCVGRLGIGLDNIDVDACEARGIAVYPASGANDVSVAEYVVTAALLLLRGAWLATPSVIAGEWPRQRLIGREASGKRLGLVGFGSIARQTARRASALGFSVAAFDPLLPVDQPAWREVERLDLAALLARSDVVSLHVPLTQTTRNMIDGEALKAMKAHAILINSSRGGVVDEDALASALRENRIGGAALDVFETEPIDGASGAKFAGLGNLILTPHIAGVTDESNVRVSAVTAENVRKHLEALT
ncbi:MAG: hydroxyacid dehydrogenase [Pseudomonadota bacterium]|nr:hydroxyacid dehydrogenase [Pseudomonadota bacterium]